MKVVITQAGNDFGRPQSLFPVYQGRLNYAAGEDLSNFQRFPERRIWQPIVPAIIFPVKKHFLPNSLSPPLLEKATLFKNIKYHVLKYELKFSLCR